MGHFMFVVLRSLSTVFIEKLMGVCERTAMVPRRTAFSVSVCCILCPACDVKLHQYRVKLHQTGCVASGMVLVKALP